MDAVHKAAEILRQADALLIAAGAGMGVDSGLPDFRGPQGFWRAYPAIAKLGLSFEEIANPSWFNRDPHLAWAFYGHRLHLYRRTIPHAGFARLLALAQAKPGGYFVFTSNVDGQFQKAGFDPERVVECHGSIHHLQCVAQCCSGVWVADGETVAVEESTFRARDPLPRCRHCSRLARPNILMFGDWDWISSRTEAQQERLQPWLAELVRAGARVAIIELGAGSAVPTVRLTCERILHLTEGGLVRINPREPQVPAGQVGLPFGALEGIERISQEMIAGQ